MVNFAGVNTGGNVPPPIYPNNSVNTGGAMHSNNPISPNVGYMPHYATVQPQQRSSKAIWVIPILLLMFLGVAGSGGGVYMWYQANSGGTTDVTPTPTATVSASPTPTVTASKTPTATPSVSPTQNVAKDDTPKPTVEPTATRPVVINTPAPRTPPPVQRTPKPKTPKKNSDCIFSGDC
jgi:hypothetical protein